MSTQPQSFAMPGRDVQAPVAEALASVSEAQRLEAIGRLSGEIAHEFNNLLHVINMNLELISVLAKEEKARPAVERARTAARRGARLTGELLSFTRGAFQAAGCTRVNELLLGMKGLLQISAGPGVELELELCEGPSAAMVDPGALELRLLGLAEGARDNLPEGGVLKISTCMRARDAAGASKDLVLRISSGPAAEDSVEMAFAVSSGT